jgi:hypothetical protein
MLVAALMMMMMMTMTHMLVLTLSFEVSYQRVHVYYLDCMGMALLQLRGNCGEAGTWYFVK